MKYKYEVRYEVIKMIITDAISDHPMKVYISLWNRVSPRIITTTNVGHKNPWTMSNTSNCGTKKYFLSE